jgi:hypothetical protein
VLELENAKWKPFRNSLGKSHRKKVDKMISDTPRLYISGLILYAVQPVRLYPTLMSIPLYCYKQLSNCISQVDQLESK